MIWIFGILFDDINFFFKFILSHHTIFSIKFHWLQHSTCKRFEFNVIILSFYSKLQFKMMTYEKKVVIRFLFYFSNILILVTRWQKFLFIILIIFHFKFILFKLNCTFIDNFFGLSIPVFFNLVFFLFIYF